jgi:multidrug resistance efflux pump
VDVRVASNSASREVVSVPTRGAGTVQRLDLRLRQRVAAGEILLVLDTTEQEVQRAEEIARRDAALARLGELRKGFARAPELAAAISATEDLLRSSEAAIRKLDFEIQGGTIRSPIDGIVASLIDVQRGKPLAAGTEVTTIAPAGSSRIVAYFAAESSGRIRSGMRAWFYPDGSEEERLRPVDAIVWSDGAVASSGDVRVEVELVDAPPHVLNALATRGHVEILTDRLRPFALVLGTRGRPRAQTQGAVSTGAASRTPGP